MFKNPSFLFDILCTAAVSYTHLDVYKRQEKDRLDGDTAVVTVMSNLGFIKYMESQGIHTEKPAVGDRYVLENMRENGYAIGGEQSGHVILLHHATTGNGELTAGKLLKLLAESGKKMSRCV